MKYFKNKLIIIIAIGTIFGSSVFFLKNKPVEAVVPVIDAEVAGILIGETLTSQAELSNKVLDTAKEYGLDSLAYSISKKLGAKLSNKVFNKVNGGASGDSSQRGFVENFYDFFSDIDTSTLDKKISELEVSDNPFANQIAKGFIKEYMIGGSDVPEPLKGFTLKTIIGDNYEDFSHDVSVGGWDGLLALSNPANTNIGSAIIAQRGLLEEQENAKEIERLRLISPGFTPQGKCTLNWEDYRDKIQTIKTTKESISGVKDQLQQAAKPTDVDNDVVTPLPPEPNPEGWTDGPTLPGPTQSNNDPIASDDNKDGKPNNSVDPSDLQALQNAQTQNSLGLAEDYGNCLSELINNPMGLASAAVQEGTNQVMKQIGEADEFGELIAGMFTQLFSGFIQGGLSSLSADFSKSKQSVGGPEQLRNRAGQSIQWTQAPSTIVDLPSEFQPAIDSTNEELRLLKQYISLISETPAGGENFISAMNRLDVCLPGPDFRYDRRLDAYITMQTKNLTVKQGRGNENKQENRATALAYVENSVAIAEAELDAAIQNPLRNIPGASIFQEHIQNTENIRNKYLEKKESIIEKQSVLNLLTKMEIDMKTSMATLRTHIPNIPTTIQFTHGGWDSLSQPEKTALLAWSKQVYGNVYGNTFTETDPIKQRNFVISVAWDVWTYPEKYITYLDNWNRKNESTNKSSADLFLESKNKIRTEYNSIADRVSIPRSTEQAKVDVSILENTLQKTKDFADDCATIKTIILQNNFTTADAHDRIKTVLRNNINRLKTDEAKNSIDAPSILTTPYNTFPAGINCSGNTCTQDAGIENVDGEGLGGDLARDSDNRYQLLPAKNVWQVIQHDNQKMLFCSFNVFLAEYPDRNTDVGNKGAITCFDSAKWSESKKSDLVGYFYGDDFR